jgi:sialic acid synthase SpsE
MIDKLLASLTKGETLQTNNLEIKRESLLQTQMKSRTLLGKYFKTYIPKSCKT